LLGFEQVQRYVLAECAEQKHLLQLNLATDPNLSFLVTPTSFLAEPYDPEISNEDAAFLQLEHPEDALILNIVTLQDDHKASVNLKGPLIINRHTLVGKQIIPRNVSSFSLQHPLNLTDL